MKYGGGSSAFNLCGFSSHQWIVTPLVGERKTIPDLNCFSRCNFYLFNFTWSTPYRYPQSRYSQYRSHYRHRPFTSFIWLPPVTGQYPPITQSYQILRQLCTVLYQPSPPIFPAPPNSILLSLHLFFPQSFLYVPWALSLLFSWFIFPCTLFWVPNSRVSP